MEAMEESTSASPSLSTEMKLLEFPDEVLLNIMLHLNDTTLLYMTHVCKRFKAIAKEAFTKIYNGGNENNYFDVKVFNENLIVERKQYQPFFCTFGEDMIAVYVYFTSGRLHRNHWIFSLIQRYCTKLSKIEIGGGVEIDVLNMFYSLPKTSLKDLKMTQMKIANRNWSEYRFPNLIHFRVDELYQYHQQHIVDFISTNNQLQEVRLRYLNVDNYLPFIKAMVDNCKNLQKLEIVESNRDTLWNIETVSILCKLTTLKWLKIHTNGLKLSQLESIVRQLSNLSALKLGNIPAESDIYQNLSRAISICQHVSDLIIVTEDLDCSKLNFELLSNIADNMNHGNRIVLSNYGKDEIIIRKGMVRRNKTIIYKHDTVCTESSTNFMDLNDKCLLKIVEFLNPKQHCALYDTCQRTREAIEKYYSENTFCTSFNSDELTDSILWCLGKQIRSMKFTSNWCTTQTDFDELWRRVNQNCTNLVELTISFGGNSGHDGYMLPIDCVWPKLKKLIFSAPSYIVKHGYPPLYAINYETLCSFVCPTLTRLEVISLKIDENAARNLDHGDHFHHLKVLKFGFYNENVKKFLLALDDNICKQIKELSIGSQIIMSENAPDDETDNESDDETDNYSKPSRIVVELINIVPRFRNLTTLNLVVPGVDLCNTKYLFENCTKLVDFGVWCNGEMSSEGLFEDVLDNCLQIETIRLFGHGIFRDFMQNICQMFPDVSVEVAIQDNISFPVTDEHPYYSDSLIHIPEQKGYSTKYVTDI